MKKVVDNKKIFQGVNQYCDLIKQTLGPTGHNVLIDSEFGKPIVTNDGYTISEAFNVKDKEIQAGAEYAKYGADKTNEESGDGRSTYAVLLQAILNGGIEYLGNTLGADPIKLRDDILSTKKDIISAISKNKKDCTDATQVATTSAKSEEIGKLVGDVYNKIGVDGVVKIEDGDGYEDEVSIVEGVEIDSGGEPMDLTSAHIILVPDKLSTITQLKEIVDPVITSGDTEILIIAHDYDAPVAKFIKMANADYKISFIQAPGFAKPRQALYEDIAAITKDMKCPQIKVDEERTILVGLDTKERVAELSKIKVDGEYDKEQMEIRIAKLKGSIAIIKVGAQTRGEQVEKKHHLKDAVRAAKAALEEGTVKGGGLALYEVEVEGNKVILDAIKAPYKQIQANGFKFTDTDVLDSFKGVKSSLENAVSIATSLLTTGAALVEDDEVKPS
jgi:chaperonin GroEL